MPLESSTPLRFLLTVSVVLLGVAGLLGWLLPPLIAVPADGEIIQAVEGDVVQADDSLSTLSIIGAVVVIAASVLVAISGRRLLLHASKIESDRTNSAVATWKTGGSFAPDLGARGSDSGPGYPGQPAFYGRIAGEVARAARYQHPFSLLSVLIDVSSSEDGAAESRSVPEAVTQTIGAIIRNTIRVSDAYAGTGVDRLLLILAETDASGAARVAEKLRRNVEVYPFGENAVTVSIGLCAFSPGATAESVIGGAEDAADRARAAGGNRIESASAQG